MWIFLHQPKGRKPVWMAGWRSDGRRRRLALGGNERTARAVLVHLEHLLHAKTFGVEPPPGTVEWLNRRCSTELADRLLKHRLISQDQRVRSLGLDEHVDAFRDHLVARERDPDYIRDRVASLRDAFDACGFRTYTDIINGATLFEQWNASAVRTPRTLRDGRIVEPKPDGSGTKPSVPASRSAARRNHTASAVSQFCRWMVKYRGESAVAPIDRSPFNAEQNRRYERFSLGERFQLLLDAAHARAEVDRGMDGPTRCTLWWLASETGYRASELGRITPRNIRLEQVPHEGATLRVMLIGVRKTKAGEPAAQAVVTPGLIDRVLDLMGRTIPTRPMFPVRTKGDWTTVAALRRDLEAAGIAPVNERGEVYDMHSLRYELGQALLVQNPANNAVKEVMRHSTIELTLKTYARATLSHKVAALMNRPMMREPRAG